ncbi:MAG: metal-dependent hydrolase, partial [Pseudonocardiaceae bacterium]
MTQANTARKVPTRRMSFDESLRDVPRHFAADGDLIASHVGGALSAVFPDGEDFFVRSVRRFRDQITDPELKRQVAGFIGQEAMHGREHRVYNAWLSEHGYPAEKLERGVIKFLEVVCKTTSRGQRLGATIALEHLTAIMADNVLGEPQVLKTSDKNMAALWRWHAIEETEHKAVAYDVYREVFGDGPVAYTRRSITMLVATGLFWAMLLTYHLRLVREEKALGDVRGWASYLRFLF